MVETTTPENALSQIQLPSLPISFESGGIIKLSLALFITGIILILITYLFFRKL